MSEQTKIQWADSTWNWVRGCTPVSEGCKHCYAAARANRFGEDFGKRIRAAKQTFNAPLQWNKKPWVCDECGTGYERHDLIYSARIGVPSEPEQVICKSCGGVFGVHRRRIFSLCDWLDQKIPAETLLDALEIIRKSCACDFLLCTKRPELWRVRLHEVVKADCLRLGIQQSSPEYARLHEEFLDRQNWLCTWLDGTPPANIQIGFTAENQEQLELRSKAASKIPAFITFISAEPLLESLDFVRAGVMHMDYEGDSSQPGLIRHFPVSNVQWIIAGGESGPHARPCNVEWIRSIVQQCKAASVPVFVKQMGSNAVRTVPDIVKGDGWIDLAVTFNHTKGGDPKEWNPELRIQQFPKGGQ